MPSKEGKVAAALANSIPGSRSRVLERSPFSHRGGDLPAEQAVQLPELNGKYSTIRLARSEDRGSGMQACSTWA